MKKHITKNLLILPFALALVASCSGKKAASPTSFKLSGLSAITADSATVPGGVVLMGSNGTDRFTAGIRATDLASFSLDLPVGTWNFSAIAWQGAAPLTGATQCGLSTTTVEGTSMVVSLTLSAANCQQAAFASAASLSTIDTQKFKTLSINSCLNPMEKLENDICDGSDVAERSDLPGESMSFRVVVSSGSSFGAAISPLSSNCYNLNGVPTGDLSSGLVDTPLTLPFGGSINMPLRIIGYESPNCFAEDISAVYPVIGGLQGTEGVYRTVFSGNAENLVLNIADNLIGVLGSPFLEAVQTSQITLPFPSCGSNCFPTTSYLSTPKRWAAARDTAHSLYGSPTGKDSDDFGADLISNSSLTLTTGAGFLTISSLPGIPDKIDVFATVAPGGDPLIVSCAPPSDPSPAMLNISYDPAAHSLAAIESAILGSLDCDSFVDVTLGADDTGILAGMGSIIPIVSAGAYSAKEREIGTLRSIAHTYIGPLGAIFAKNGLSTFTQLCSAAPSRFTHSLPTGRTVEVQLSDASMSATLPTFPTNMGGQFEKKISISFDGTPTESFYFNCVNNKGIGSHVEKETKNGESYIEQVFWDTTPTEQWVESVSYYENINTTDTRREYVLSHLSGNTIKFWKMEGDSAFLEKFVASVDIAGATLYAQDSTSLATNNINFVANANDESYSLDGAYNGLGTVITVNPPTTINLIFDSSIDSFLAEDPSNPTDVWDLNL